MDVLRKCARGRLVLVLGLVFSGCGGTTPAGDAEADGDADADIDADVDGDGDGQRDADPDAEADADFRSDADPETDASTDWRVGVEVLGVGPAVGAGVLGPIFPLDLLITPDLVVIVGMARADFVWDGVTVSRGGYVLALDRATSSYRWHRTIGDSINAVALVDDQIVIAGEFHGTITVSPARDGDFSLTARGAGTVAPSDIIVARLGLDGTFSWAFRAGSIGFDGAFGVAVNGERLVVVGFVSNAADLRDECPLAVTPFPGSIDIEGNPVGTWDGFVFSYDATTGDCIDGFVVGREASQDFAFDVTPHGSGFAVSGESTLPLSVRDAAGTATALDGPETADVAPWLITLTSSGAVDQGWFVSADGRGRAVGSSGSTLMWTLASSGGDLVEPHGTLAIDPLVSLIELSPTGARAHALPGRTLDVMSLAASADGWITGATRSDPRGTVLVQWGPLGVRFHEGTAATVQPLRFAADGSTVLAAGCVTGSGTLGEPPTMIEAGPQGGLVLLRLE